MEGWRAANHDGGGPNDQVNVKKCFQLFYCTSSVLVIHPSLSIKVYQAMAEKYILRITAGPSYDAAHHVEVPVNTPQPVRISSHLADIELNVRIRDYRGLPRGAPASSPYFDSEPHAYNQDKYSICFRFTPKAPKTSGGNEVDGEEESSSGISGLDLQFGNDFDRPIRDRLPRGFNKALGIVRWWIDPGLDGDIYADQPYLYGPALSSFNTLSIGPASFDETKGGLWVEEGGDAGVREALGMPGDAKTRMKWALSDDVKGRWVYEYGQTYAVDFFNPYIDFANFSLRLPGFQLPVLKYWDGQALR